MRIKEANRNFYSRKSFLDFVKDRVNIFNDKTVYRTKEFLNSYIVYEYNYFNKETHLWVWISRIGSNEYIVIPTECSKKSKRVVDLTQKAYNELQNNK